MVNGRYNGISRRVLGDVFTEMNKVFDTNFTEGIPVATQLHEFVVSTGTCNTWKTALVVYQQLQISNSELLIPSWTTMR